ncbi:MAG: hypothetical protein NC253_01020 [Ruminococcus sp.]|nr:hypothetical protein [Ruminococcus sp.]MCM1382324.1 hypothetical protein [Muribaculaceae bacterium]
MSKIISQSKFIEKFNHFNNLQFEDSICLYMDSFERCVYIFGNKFRINRCICISVNENGGIITLELDNLAIAAKPKYSEDFVGYVKINEICEKISNKYPYNYDHSFVFAFECENAALSVILTKPAATNGSLSGMSIDVGMKGNIVNNYDKVMEGISAVISLLKSTALQNVEISGAFTKFFEPLSALPCKGADEISHITQQEEDDDYV